LLAFTDLLSGHDRAVRSGHAACGVYLMIAPLAAIVAAQINLGADLHPQMST
jgi:hypothetical protein